MEDNDKEDNNFKDISALVLDRDLGFLRGYQGHWPPYDDEEEEVDKVDDNNDVEDNDKDDNNFKDISALGLERDMGFSQGHQGHWPPDDDEEENDEVDDNDKDNNNFKDISALGLDRVLGFSRRYQTILNSRRFSQIGANSH